MIFYNKTTHTQRSCAFKSKLLRELATHDSLWGKFV